MTIITDLLYKTFTSIARGTYRGDEALIFTVSPEEVYAFFHYQDCCESVEIDDIVGDLDDLVGSPLLMAEKVTNSGYGDEDDWPDTLEKPKYLESWTWTFYKFATMKGRVTVRWFGTSNGYYSESVSFERIT